MFRIEKPTTGLFSPHILTHVQEEEKPQETTVEELEKQVHEIQPMTRKKKKRICGEKLLKKIARKQTHPQKRKRKQTRSQKRKPTKNDLKKLSKHMSLVLREL